MNPSGILSGIAKGAQNFGKKVAGGALSAANSAERALGGAYSKITGKSGWQGQNTFNAAAGLGVVKDSPATTHAMLTPAEGLLKSMFAPTAYSDRLVPTMQLTSPPSQPSAASKAVPASVLTSPMSAPTQDVQRTGRAFVPMSPLANAGPGAVSPSATMPQATSPAGVGAAHAVSPAALSAPNSVMPNSPSSFGAAAPQEAVIRALASLAGRSAPTGYVEAPESLQFGARPRRKLANAD